MWSLWQNTEKIGEFKGFVFGCEVTFPQYNFNMLTYIQGIHICDDCMDIYRKIDAIKRGRDFSCGGVNYYADARNLKH